MLTNVSVILVRTRFPENIGMVARAMSNMGAESLILVSPERWGDVDKEKAEKLATSQGTTILANAKVCSCLEEALSSFTFALAATARTGGWRKTSLTPEDGAVKLRQCSREGGKVAIVYGSEDKGLTNAEVILCSDIMTIPTAVDHSSLNLAQAVLLTLYACFQADTGLPFSKNTGQKITRLPHDEGSRRATLTEEQVLFTTLTETLLAIDHLHGDNPEWFMQPLRRFLRKSRLRRHEFDMLMGICRQVENRLKVQAK